MPREHAARQCGADAFERDDQRDRRGEEAERQRTTVGVEQPASKRRRKSDRHGDGQTDMLQGEQHEHRRPIGPQTAHEAPRQVAERLARAGCPAPAL